MTRTHSILTTIVPHLAATSKGTAARDAVVKGCRFAFAVSDVGPVHVTKATALALLRQGWDILPVEFTMEDGTVLPGMTVNDEGVLTLVPGPDARTPDPASIVSEARDRLCR